MSRWAVRARSSDLIPPCFSAKLCEETDFDALNAEVVGAARKTMQPTHFSLWLRLDMSWKDSGGQSNPIEELASGCARPVPGACHGNESHVNSSVTVGAV
jgi:hypothetical protein